MRKLLFFFLFFSSICLFPCKSNSQPLQWKSMGGPIEGEYNCTVANNILFAWHPYGGWDTYRSTNNGDYWERITMDTINDGWQEIYEIVNKDSILLALTYFGIYRSVDNGKKWQHIEIKGYSPTAIIIRGQTIYVEKGDPSGYSIKVDYSTDDGISWTSIPEYRGNYQEGKPLTFMVEVGKTVFGGVSNGNIYQLTDTINGWHWTDTGFPTLPLRPNYCIFNNDLHIETKSGIFFIDEKGRGGELNRNFFSNNYITALCATKKVLFVALQNKGLYRSMDSGNAWESINKGIEHHVFGLAAKDNLLFAGTADGMYRSNDTGNSWEQINNGFKKIITNDITTYVDSPFVAVPEEGGLLHFIDSTKTWRSIDNSDSINAVNFFTKQGDFLLAYTTNDELLHFIAKELHWEKCATMTSIDSINEVSRINALALKDSEILAATGNLMNTFYNSSDYGVSWSRIKSSLVDRVNALGILRTTYFAATEGYLCSAIYSSTDFGFTWTFLDSLQSNVKDIIVIGTDVYISTDSLGIYRSWDMGKTFYPITGNQFKTINAITGNDKILFISADISGVYYSLDKGNTWIKSNAGLASTHVQSLALGSSKLFAGTDSGVFQTFVADSLTAGVRGYNLRSSIELLLSPNPVTDELTLIYTSVNSTQAEIEIFDLLGKLVMKVNDNNFQRGPHTVKLNTHTLSAGSYILQLHSGSESTSKVFKVNH